MKIDHNFMERVILFRALTNEGYLAAVIDFITPDIFEDRHISDIIGVISDFHDRNNTCPSLTEVKTLLTTEELIKSFKSAIEQVKDVDVKFNNEELIRNTEQFIKERRVYNTLLETAKTISDGDADTSLILTKFEDACNINLITDHGIEVFGDIDKIAEDLTKKDPVISSGWDWMDEMLGGGFQKVGRAIYVFAGRPNVGKSIFLGNIANNISTKNKNVLVVTLEMSEMVYAKRMCSNITAIPISELPSSTTAMQREINKINESHPDRRIFIKEFPPSTVTTKQLSAFVKKMESTGINFDAIVVDYLNLLHSTNGSNSYERVKDIIEQLRAMSYIYECPIITATQLNRGGMDEEKPGMNSLSESVGVAATSDFIASLWQDEEDVEYETIHVGVMKNRFGRAIGSSRFKIDYTTLTLSELVDSDLLPIDGEENDIYNSFKMLADS